MSCEKNGKGKGGLVIALSLVAVLAVVAVVLIVTSDSRKYNKYMKLAEEYLADEEYEDAVDALEDALDFKEDDETATDMLAEAYMQWAKVCLEKGDMEKASELIGKANKVALGNKGTNSGESGSAGSDEVFEEILVSKVPSDGKVLNIYCYDEKFNQYMTDIYPGYEMIDMTTGKIGEITVKWNFTPRTDNSYQNVVDSTLMKYENAKADDQIDLFIVEQEYAQKYVSSSYTLPLTDLGISVNKVFDEQYQYTKDVVTDSSGALKGITWQISPCVLFYNREIAKEVLGTDDPAMVQSYVKDWESFMDTAELMSVAGYDMVSSVYDTYRLYSQNASAPWVTGYELHIDEKLVEWVNHSKYLLDIGAAGTHNQWTDEWKKGFYPGGNVFCYIGTNSMINDSMDCDVEGSIASYGGWGAVEGPASANWEGQWLCVGVGTDNGDLIKDIILKMTTDEQIMSAALAMHDEMVNNKSSMESAISSNYSKPYLGGQNSTSAYHENALKLDLSNITTYDGGLDQLFCTIMKEYFEGNITYDEALQKFNRKATEWYPELTK